MAWPVSMNGNTYNQVDFSGFAYATTWSNFFNDVSAVAGRATAEYQAFTRAVASGPVVSVNGMSGPVNTGNSGNRIINGDFRIAQRGTSFAVTNANVYTLDRWFATSGAATMTVSQQANQALWVDRVPAFFMRLDCASGASTSAIRQRIEDVRSFAGRRVTLSFKAKGGAANTTIDRILVQQNFGSGGDASVSPLLMNGIALTTAPGQYSYTFNMPDVANKVIGTNSYVEVWIYPKVGSTAACVIDVADISIDETTSAQNPLSRFDERDQAIEHAQCERRYERIGIDEARYASAAGQQLVIPIRYNTRKRAPPALAFVAAGTLTNATATLAQSADPSGGARLTLTATAAGLVSISNAILGVDAEL